ncbi:MAG: alpha amylase catalytic region [Fusobacteriales bacterium]|jgi:hypothetical protein|nr:alpha amylase catalytic region [Fusobacteriales bacterium]
MINLYRKCEGKEVFEIVKIYNLFPLMAGKISDWIDKLDEIKDMNFDAIYLNPIYQTGYSRNIYAPKNFYEIDEKYLDPFSEKSPAEQFKEFINEAHKRDMKVILELIVTHTAIDSDLLLTHPEWYKYNEYGEIKKYSINNYDTLVEWGDLLEINNYHGDETIRTYLWKYWIDLALHYENLGIDGIKIHSAFNVPMDLVKEIVENLKSKNSEFIIIGDNLGASFNDMLELAQAGVDYLFSSFKWWNFRATWFLEQHYKLKEMVKMISFPENYDTERVAMRYNENIEASKAFYILAALINSSIMIPIGFEHGNKVKLNELRGLEPELNIGNLDLKEYILHVNRLKDEINLFSEENDIYYLSQENPNIFAFKRISRDKKERALIIANLNFISSQYLKMEDIYYILESDKVMDLSLENKEEIENKFYEKTLNPGEVRVLYTKD